MRTNFLKSTVITAIALALAVSGCASMGGKSPEEQVAEKLTAWKTALEANDLDGLMLLYSDNFEHYEYGDKAGMKDFLMQASDMGYLEGIEVSLELTETTIEGDKAVAFPVDVIGAFGALAFEHTLTNEDGVWMITGSDASGL